LKNFFNKATLGRKAFGSPNHVGQGTCPFPNSSNKMFWEDVHLQFPQRKGDLTQVEKSYFVNCVKQLKVLFVIILETKIILNDIYSCLKQVAKWVFIY
jgi:hypothetical protein